MKADSTKADFENFEERFARFDRELSAIREDSCIGPESIELLTEALNHLGIVMARTTQALRGFFESTQSSTSLNADLQFIALHLCRSRWCTHDACWRMDERSEVAVRTDRLVWAMIDVEILMQPPRPISDPKLIEIDNAFTELEPILDQHTGHRGFRLSRGHGGSGNIPRRFLRRWLPRYGQDIHLAIAAPMPVRLERGFYPEIPCHLYIQANYSSRTPNASRYCVADIAEALPYAELRLALPDLLKEALARLEPWTRDYVSQHGLLTFPN